jgi:hypothetical protein
LPSTFRHSYSPICPSRSPSISVNIAGASFGSLPYRTATGRSSSSSFLSRPRAIERGSRLSPPRSPPRPQSLPAPFPDPPIRISSADALAWARNWSLLHSPDSGRAGVPCRSANIFSIRFVSGGMLSNLIVFVPPDTFTSMFQLCSGSIRGPRLSPPPPPIRGSPPLLMPFMRGSPPMPRSPPNPLVRGSPPNPGPPMPRSPPLLIPMPRSPPLPLNPAPPPLNPAPGFPPNPRGFPPNAPGFPPKPPGATTTLGEPPNPPPLPPMLRFMPRSPLPPLPLPPLSPNWLCAGVTSSMTPRPRTNDSTTHFLRTATPSPGRMELHTDNNPLPVGLSRQSHISLIPL